MAAIMAAGEKIGGNGDVTFRVFFHQGEARGLDILGSRQHHRLARPLTNGEQEATF